MPHGCGRSCVMISSIGFAPSYCNRPPYATGPNRHNAWSETGEVEMNFSRYRVKPGSDVRLKDWNAADKRGVPSDKQERVALLSDLSEDINALQDLLYAAHEKGVLI